MSGTLKEKARPEVRKLTIVFVFFVVWSFNIEFSNGDLENITQVFSLSAIYGAAVMFLTLISTIVPRQAKEFLVFWRVKHRTPSYRAFSDKIINDERVNKGTLQEIYDPLPAKPEESFRAWYGFYKNIKENGAVNDAHYNYLLYREFCVHSLFFIVFLVPLCFVEMTSNIRVFISLVIFGVVYILSLIAARMAANNFLVAVLSEASNAHRPSLKAL